MFPRLGYGLGLRPPHYEEVCEHRPPHSLLGRAVTPGTPCRGAHPGEAGVCELPRHVDWWEVLTENFMVAGGNPRRVLRMVRERWPVVLHGVSLSIGSVEPLDESYLDKLAELVAEIDPPLVSDHLCWSRLGSNSVHDLWPLPYTEEALAHVVSRVAHVQERLGRRILLENPSSYATFAASELGEAEFLAEVADRADCGILLDVNNVYVSCQNHGWDPERYMAAIPRRRVGQIHLAGHSDRGTHLLDTHDHPVCDAVWDLYGRATQLLGDVATMIERDDRIPPLHELVSELARARAIGAGASPDRVAYG